MLVRLEPDRYGSSSLFDVSAVFDYSGSLM